MILIGIISLLTSFVPKEITWVALGDSITYLNDHANETSNRVTKGCLTRVTEKLPSVHYINHGYNGRTAGGIAKQSTNSDCKERTCIRYCWAPLIGGRDIQ